MKIWLALALALLFPGRVIAVTTDIISYPTTIGEDKFSVTIQVASASAGTNYLRIDLYKDGTKNYFGETDNGQSWYGGSDGKLYFPITIVSGVPAVATVSARIGDPSQSDYPGPGVYKIRARRYTSSGNQGSEDTISRDITLNKSWPSPSPSPVASVAPTVSPSPMSTVAPTPTPSPSLKPSPTVLPSPSISMAGDPTVAGVAVEIDLSSFGAASSSPDASHRALSSSGPSLNTSRLKSVVSIGLGMITLSVASYFAYKKYLASKNNDES